jgi:hypothetical protein
MVKFENTTKRFELVILENQKEVAIVVEEQRKAIEGLKKEVTIAIENNSKATEGLSNSLVDVRDMVSKLEQRILSLEAVSHHKPAKNE